MAPIKQRIFSSDRLDSFQHRRDRFDRLPVRLRLIEAPLHRLGKVFGDLRALNVCNIQVIFEMQRHLCRQSCLFLRLSIAAAKKQKYGSQYY
ncbi:MAG: hypothetical protein ACYS80_09205 [Planctomycetota bacterium]|jgi:hypothetical protein